MMKINIQSDVKMTASNVCGDLDLALRSQGGVDVRRAERPGDGPHPLTLLESEQLSAQGTPESWDKFREPAGKLSATSLGRVARFGPAM